MLQYNKYKSPVNLYIEDTSTLNPLMFAISESYIEGI